MTPENIINGFFAAVESCDLEAIGGFFSAEARYVNVPYPPAVGRQEIIEMFRPIVSRSQKIEWIIASSAYSESRAHVERLDCFWINGRRYSVPCHCVAEVDALAGVITEFRDYVDVGLWRETLGDALTR